MKFVNHVLMVLFAVAFSVVKSSPDEEIKGLGDDFFVVNVDDEVLKEIASFAVTEISRSSSSDSAPFSLLTILSAKKQEKIDAQTLHFYAIRLRLSGLLDGNIENCQAFVRVLYEGLTSTQKMVSFQCEPDSLPSYDEYINVDVDYELVKEAPSPTNLVEEPVIEEHFIAKTAPCYGCPRQLNPDTKENLEKANFALSDLEMATNSKKVMSVVRVLTASSQVIDSRCCRFKQVLTV